VKQTFGLSYRHGKADLLSHWEIFGNRLASELRIPIIASTRLRESHFFAQKTHIHPFIEKAPPTGEVPLPGLWKHGMNPLNGGTPWVHQMRGVHSNYRQRDLPQMVRREASIFGPIVLILYRSAPAH
jgi:hypothetical protein